MQTPKEPRLLRAALSLLIVGVLASPCVALPGQPSESQAEQLDRRTEQLIEQLGDPDYFVRQRAEEELAKLSFEVFDALDQATTHEDLEIAARARYLLRRLRVEWTTKDDPEEVRKLLADYEQLDPSTKRTRMSFLARLPERKGIPAMCRLVRYEKSPVLARVAALLLLELQPNDEPPDEELSGMLRLHLHGSRRAAASWLLTWVRFADQPEEALTRWAELIEAEQAQLKTQPQQTSPRIVAALVRYQVPWLKKLNRSAEAMAALRRLIDLEDGDPDNLAALVHWLIEEKAWKLVDELATRFERQFAESAVLLYGQAEAQTKGGDHERAEATAQRARSLDPGSDRERLVQHYYTARRLRDRGLFSWARKEYRHVIETGKAGSFVVVFAHSTLAEMLHDQSEDLDAVKVLEDLAKMLKEHPDAETKSRLQAAEVRSRMNYFSACDARGKDDPVKHREYLDKAIEADAADIDVLIACHRLPDQKPEYRAKIDKLIKQSAAAIRREIETEPDNPTHYNQFAWLVGNTGVDLDEALKFSKKSLELDPGNGGYLDTLAHVYFARGQYEEAVKTQTKAAEQEPHSGLIVRQLERFRKKWEEQQKNP